MASNSSHKLTAQTPIISRPVISRKNGSGGSFKGSRAVFGLIMSAQAGGDA